MKLGVQKDEPIPDVPLDVEPGLRRFLDALKDKTQKIFRECRNDLNRVVYMRNLIKNGNFSVWTGAAGDAPDAWSKIGTPTSVSGAGFILTIQSAGFGNEGCSQTLSGLKASTAYMIICYARATAGDSAKMWTTGGDKNASVSTTSESWERMESIFKTDGSATDVAVCVGSDTSGDVVYFDDVEVYEYY